MENRGIPYELRPLSLGDYMWIVSYTDIETSQKIEYVLNCVVERKRYDDMVKSILDQRHSEQKLRILESDFTRKIYLCEGDVKCLTDTHQETSFIVKGVKQANTITEVSFVLTLTHQKQENKCSVSVLSVKI